MIEAPMIFAVLVAPLLAVQVQKWTELWRERRQRKLHVFQTLMATRLARVSQAHVQALNMIDITFYGWVFVGRNFRSKGEQDVLDSWKAYHDHLNTPSDNTTWAERGNDLFVELLHVMAKALGYHFDKIDLKKRIYSPQAHGDEELHQQIAKTKILDLLSGKSALPVTIMGAGDLKAVEKARDSEEAEHPSPESAHNHQV